MPSLVMCGPFLSAWALYLGAEHSEAAHVASAAGLAAMVLAPAGPFVGAAIRYCSLAPKSLYRWSYINAGIALVVNIGLALVTTDLIVPRC